LVRRHRGLGNAAVDHHDQLGDFSAPLAGSRQAVSAVAADYSTNSIAFDGLLTTAFINAAAGNAYLQHHGDGHCRRRHAAHRLAALAVLSRSTTC
jgi:hypothetical protein